MTSGWRLWIWPASVVSMAACVRASQLPTQDLAARADTSAFAVVLRAIRTDSTMRREIAPFYADPRPFRAGDDNVPDVAIPVASSPAELAARRATLGALEIAADSTGLPANCSGTERPPGGNERRGCPAQGRVVARVSVLRPGDATAAKVDTNDRRFWTARVLLSFIGPSGVAVQSSDYVLERSGGVWTFVRKKPLMWAE